MMLAFFEMWQWALIIGLAILVIILLIIKKKQQQY
jgi:LPXTG-motif cell wall-anchored protein